MTDYCILALPKGFQRRNAEEGLAVRDPLSISLDDLKVTLPSSPTFTAGDISFGLSR